MTAHGKNVVAGADAVSPVFFKPYRPQGWLGQFVQFIWIARGQVAHNRERVLPNGVVELIVNLGNPHRVLDRDDCSRQRLYRHCWVAGIQNRYLLIESVQDTDLVGIRFKPGGAYPFLGLPLSELTDHVVEFDLIDRSLVAELCGRLFDAHSDLERIACVERILTNRLDPQRLGHFAVQYICDAIRAGTIRIGDLVARTGLSHRRLMGHFERTVGMTPKALARIHKFQNLLMRIEGMAAPNWSDTATECGYYDQPHFNHEFRSFSGLTPAEYLATRLVDFNHTVAD